MKEATKDSISQIPFVTISSFAKRDLCLGELLNMNKTVFPRILFMLIPELLGVTQLKIKATFDSSSLQVSG